MIWNKKIPFEKPFKIFLEHFLNLYPSEKVFKNKASIYFIPFSSFTYITLCISFLFIQYKSSLSLERRINPANVTYIILKVPTIVLRRMHSLILYASLQTLNSDSWWFHCITMKVRVGLKKKVKLSERTFAIDYETVSDMCVGRRGGWMVVSCMIY